MTDKVHSFFNVPDNYLHRKYGVRLRSELVDRWVSGVRDFNILDVGCGDGGVSLHFLSTNRIVFCDISERMLELVESQVAKDNKTSAEFFHGSISDYNTTKTFDLIFCIGVLAHVPSVELTISKLTTLLKPGGKLILQFSDANHWLTRWSMRNARYEYSVNKIRYSELEALCIASSLQKLAEIRYHFLLPGMGKLPDSWLYSFQRMTVSPSLLSNIGTDYLWLLKKI